MKKCSICGECHEKTGLGCCVAALLGHNKEMELQLRAVVSAEYSDRLAKHRVFKAASDFLDKRK